MGVLKDGSVVGVGLIEEVKVDLLGVEGGFAFVGVVGLAVAQAGDAVETGTIGLLD